MDKQFDKDVRRMFEWVRNRIRKWVKKNNRNFIDCSFDELSDFNREVSIIMLKWHRKEMARLTLRKQAIQRLTGKLRNSQA